MAENEIVKEKKMTLGQYEKMLKGMLEAEIDENVTAVPADMNKKRFALNCMAVFKNDPSKFSNCAPETLVAAFMEGAYLGLDFFNGECYAIPYGGQVNFQTDYKGERKLAKKYSAEPIKDIYAKVVREGDEFVELIENGEQTISFKPQPFSNKPIIGAFAVVMFKDGSMLYETMSKEEIEEVRKGFSKAANSKAWKNTPGEMYKKTVLRRLLKGVDLVFDNDKQDKAFTDGADFDVQKANEEVVVDVAHDAFTVEEPQEVIIEEVKPVEREPEEAEFESFGQAYERGTV